MRFRSTIFAACLAATGLQPAALSACGYDNPQSIALGSLNWVYPDALYVTTAVTEAEAAGLLPVTKLGSQTGPLAFYRATAAMKAFGGNLADPRLADGGVVVSVVLLPQAMWTRFVIGPDGVVVYGHHEEGPAESDLVIVTAESVVRALVDGKLDSVSAEKDGLLRFYGNLDHLDTVKAALATANRGAAALPVRFARPVLAPQPAGAAPQVPATF